MNISHDIVKLTCDTKGCNYQITGFFVFRYMYVGFGGKNEEKGKEKAWV